MAAIGGFRSDLSITCKTDRNFGNVAVGLFQSRVSTKTVVNLNSYHIDEVLFCLDMILFQMQGVQIPKEASQSQCCRSFSQ